MDRLDEIFGDCDGPLAALPVSESQRLSGAINHSMGVHGVHDVKSLRADAETACEGIYGLISDTERKQIVNEALDQCISAAF
jgi:hypothetical protein